MKAKDKNYDALLTEMRKVWGSDQSMIDYCMREASQCVVLSDGKMMVKFEQPRIEKDFCFGYSTCGQGMEYDEARDVERNCNDHIEQYFMAHNRRKDGYEDDIKALQDSDRKLYLGIHYNRGELLMLYVCVDPWQLDRVQSFYNSKLVLSEHQEEDKALLIDAIRMEQQKHEKRLRQWWKRYGAEKCRTWTYWVDE